MVNRIAVTHTAAGDVRILLVCVVENSEKRWKSERVLREDDESLPKTASPSFSRRAAERDVNGIAMFGVSCSGVKISKSSVYVQQIVVYFRMFRAHVKQELIIVSSPTPIALFGNGFSFIDD